MKFLLIMFSVFSVSAFSETLLECQNGKCSEIIRLSVDEDYRIFDNAKHLKVNHCYKRKGSGYIYFYKVESIEGHFINVLYERYSAKKSFEYMLYRERIAFQDSDLNAGVRGIQEFPCSRAPKLWDSSYISSCIGKRKNVKRKNFCKRPIRVLRDFRKGARP